MAAQDAMSLGSDCVIASAEGSMKNLEKLRLQTLLRTYGNSHSTLVGLISDWWVSTDVENHWVLDSGPSFPGNGPHGKGRGNCDLMLGHGLSAVGVVEVEAHELEWCLKKIGRFWNDKRAEFGDLTLAILFLYPDKQNGRLKERHVPEWPYGGTRGETLAEVNRLTAQHPGKTFVLLELCKRFDRDPGISARRLNPYYHCTPTCLHAMSSADGEVVAEKVYS